MRRTTFPQINSTNPSNFLVRQSAWEWVFAQVELVETGGFNQLGAMAAALNERVKMPPKP